ncbi:MAG TPA: hypothetical protein VHT30_02005 [Acidimicrobiales bacterium]|jgi:hypothetical protein|nr:hypothetical protein [Acidimicrobiales bacterium]
MQTSYDSPTGAFPQGTQAPEAAVPPYPQYPTHFQPQYPAPTRTGGRPFTIAAVVCAVLALLVLPPVFGIAGLVLGLVGWHKGDRLGLYAAIAAVVCLIGGMALGAYVVSQAPHTGKG